MGRRHQLYRTRAQKRFASEYAAVRQHLRESGVIVRGGNQPATAGKIHFARHSDLPLVLLESIRAFGVGRDQARHLRLRRTEARIHHLQLVEHALRQNRTSGRLEAISTMRPECRMPRRGCTTTAYPVEHKRRRRQPGNVIGQGLVWTPQVLRHFALPIGPLASPEIRILPARSPATTSESSRRTSKWLGPVPSGSRGDLVSGHAAERPRVPPSRRYHLFYRWPIVIVTGACLLCLPASLPS